MASSSNNSVINHINIIKVFDELHNKFSFFLCVCVCVSSFLFCVLPRSMRFGLFVFAECGCQINKIDFSKFNFPREIWFSKPSTEILYKLLTLLPILLFGAIGNLLLLNIIARNRALHTPTNHILANMISADTLTLLICPMMFVCNDFFQNFILGPIGCRMDGFLQGSFHLYLFLFRKLVSEARFSTMARI